ncbi:MAG: hypothetical protein AB8B63_03535 [Granulosicoccus sp.]
MRRAQIPLLFAYALYFLLVSLVGAAGAFGWSNRILFADLWYSAYEQRYLVMIGEVGPVTYLVYHEDYTVLEAATCNKEDILGVEMYEFPSMAAMAFTGADAHFCQLWHS